MASNNPVVKVGQIWQDNDKRMPFRQIYVLDVTNDFAFCSKRFSSDMPFEGRIRIAITRMRPNSTGYRLISEAK